MADKVLVLVGTKKGLFIAESDAARKDWSLRGPYCEHWPINHAIADPETGTIYAGGGSEWFGPAVWKSDDLGETWSHSSEGLAYDEGKEPVSQVWSLARRNGTLYAGVQPAGLFSSADGGNSWYVNSPAHGAYENAILNDLIPHAEVQHNLGGKRDMRAIAGLSMGGYGALRLAFRNPSRFVMTAALSAAIFPDLSMRTDVSEQQVGFFKGAFGTPFEVAEFNRQNFFADIPSLAAQQRPPAIYITVGDDDGFGLYEGNTALYLALKRAGVPVEFRMTDGNHTWRLWREEIENVLRFYGRLLSARAE